MKIKKVLIIGSGALKIGEAGEFDYSGTQALKALKEENIFTILINPNIATVQTSEKIANKIYFLPITTHFVEKIIRKEQPQGILLAFGGQTALNCGIDLFKKGIIKKYNLKVLGTSIESIIDSEDRDIFCVKLNTININTAKSIAVNSLENALEAVKKIGFPVIIRSAYALGGLGSGFANNLDELKNLVSKSLSYTDQILIEESLKGWKEIEYEIVRDNFNNCIAVCNMENFDPIGIHTGESIVVAPSQTLTNYEYHNLRTISINIAKYFKIIGECNVQFALSPTSSEYRVIEINARLSRSSALASKATGYPLAFIAAKISLGYGLHQLKNVVNKNTSAFFEPALDYVVCKLPRWDLKKFYGVSDKIGSSMKSIGEVMAIGGSFEEAFQKGIRMLDIGLKGFINNTYKTEKIFFNIKKLLKVPTDQRLKVLELAFEKGYTIKEINNLTKIDIWFLSKLENLFQTKKILKSYKNWTDIPDEYLWQAKKQGFSDEQILSFYIKDSEIFSHIKLFKNMRKSKGILPYTRQIDTLAAEYPSNTNYLYLTYYASQHDISYEYDKKSIIVLGSGVYRIGSSVEFDWCCVNCLQTIQKLGYRAVMINYNPETVSTDFDICDRLYFEELNIERILDIIDLENPKGVIISMGGQIPNNLALKLYKLGVNILGTSPVSIDNVENRYKFSKALDALNIKQPSWKELIDYKSINAFITKVGYPVLIRPSYVLSGAAMNVVFNSKDLEKYIKEAINISPTYPVVVTKFIDNAKELEFDAVADNGKIIYHAISEHIEFAGVHSGDATLIYPTQSIYLSTLNMIYSASEKIAKYFNISGPFNIQFLSKKNKLQVIECNLRASRSFPFISKISRFNMIDLATKVLLNNKLTISNNKNISIKHIGVKASQFSFSRLQGADPILRVDMTSTGEVGCIGYNFNDVIIKAMLSVGYNIPKKNILISGYTIHSNFNLIEIVQLLYEHGYKIYTTKNIYDLLLEYNTNSTCLHSNHDHNLPQVIEFIKNKKIDLIINLHKNIYQSDYDNDYYIRRTAIDFNVPLITNANLAKVFIKAFCKIKYDQIDISDWNSYFLNN